VKLLSAVKRKHCLTYINAWLKKRGNSDRTRYNKFLHLRQFLKRNGLTDHLTSDDAPECSVKDPVAFDDEELALFWQVCRPHKQLLFAENVNSPAYAGFVTNSGTSQVETQRYFRDDGLFQTDIFHLRLKYKFRKDQNALCERLVGGMVWPLLSLGCAAFARDFSRAVVTSGQETSHRSRGTRF